MMRKTLVWFLAPLLLMVGTAFASDPILVVIDNKLVKVDNVVSPKVSIQGADTPVPLGEIVILQAKVKDEIPNYVKNREYEWNVTESGYKKQLWVDNDKVVFGAGVKPTKIAVDLKVKLTYEVGGEQLVLVSEQKADVMVGGSPDPTPPDPPAPVPTPLTGLSKMVYDWAMSAGPTDKKSAIILAKGFREIGVQAGHDLNLKDAKSILAKTKTTNNSNLTAAGIDPKIWDAWGAKLQDYLYDKYNSKELATVEQYKTAWDQIDKGLSALK